MSGSPDRTSAARPKRKFVDSGLIILTLSTLLAGLLLARRDGLAEVLSVAAGAMGFLAILLPKVAAGMFVAAAIPILVPRDRIAHWIGAHSGWGGLAFAGLAGALIPGGPALTFALVAGLLTAGADIGAAFAFVTAWSLLSLNRTLIWELSFLPYDLVGLRILLCLPAPLLVGALARKVLRA